MLDRAHIHDDSLVDDNRNLKRFGLIALVVAILIVVIGIATRISSHSALEATAADAAIPTVKTIAPEQADLKGSLVLPGNVSAYNSAPIFARTNGYVRRWLVDIGDRVHAGQSLAVLDTPDVDQQLAQAEADYQTAVANQRLAVTTAKRWQSMLAQDAVSQQETDEKNGDLAARTALANAALANVKRLKALQGFSQLQAPFAGVVTSRSAQIGALVMAGTSAAQPLFTVSDIHRMRIYVRVPQDKSAALKEGLHAKLTLPEYPGRAFDAVLTSTASAVDSGSGTMLVQLQVDNPDSALKPGAYAQVEFPIAGSARTVQLPASALIYGTEGPTVAVVENGRARIRKVTIGQDEGAVIQIATGLTGREQVIDSPPDALADGDQVRVQAKAAGDAADAQKK